MNHDRLRTAHAQVQASTGVMTDAKLELLDAIREELEAGASIQVIATALGLSKSRAQTLVSQARTRFNLDGQDRSTVGAP